MLGRGRHARSPDALSTEILKRLYRATPLFTGQFMAFTGLFGRLLECVNVLFTGLFTGYVNRSLELAP